MSEDPLNPYAPPRFDPNLGGAAPGRPLRARRQGDLLVVEKEARLPDVCMKCAATQGLVRRKQNFQYIPPWVYIFFVVCNLGAIIAMAFATKRAKLDLPLCADCNRRWRGATIATVLAILGLLSPLLLIPLAGSSDIGIVMGGLFLAALVALIVVLVAYVKPRLLQAKKIDDTTILLAGVHPSAVSAIVQAAGELP